MRPSKHSNRESQGEANAQKLVGPTQGQKIDLTTNLSSRQPGEIYIKM